MSKQFDILETRAVAKVAANLSQEQFNFPADALPEFIQYVINDFGEALRKEVEQGGAPF